ncbi:hypothetical protein [Micromonospora sp. NPDC047527]|uniref:hypothetical protein n=1 Tax=unclassified Micromonospora TaxID=2617518 RepID=UPI0033D9A623
MNMADEPVMAALRLVAVGVGVAAVALGLKVAVSRQFPAAWIRLARLKPRHRAQPVRLGSFQAMIGAGLVIQQVPFLIDTSLPVGRALFAVSLLLLVTAAGTYAVLRR